MAKGSLRKTPVRTPARKSASRKDAKLGLRILLTNDDGIHAPGLKILERIGRALSDDIWVVAPEEEQSGAGHSLSLANPLRLRRIKSQRFAVRGTPTDCVMMAVRHLMWDNPPNLVLSGVNRGQNVADDVTYSGTIAAAMEGTVLGIPSIALSQAHGINGAAETNLHWATAEHYAPDIIRKLIDTGWPKDVLININFPDVTHNAIKGIEVTSQGKRDQSLIRIEERIDARNTPYYWLGFERIASNPPEGTDLRAMYSDRISITPLHMNLSHGAARKALARVFSPLK